MKRKYRVKVYIRRNEQPCYSYFAYPQSVKAAKVEDIVLQVAEDIFAHETRSGWFSGSWMLQLGSGYVIRVGDNRFIVRRV